MSHSNVHNIIEDVKPKKELDMGTLMFSTFDISRVLERGAPLLASGGAVCCIFLWNGID